MVVVAVVLTGSNVVGFTKCSKQASKQIRDMASSAITTGLTVSGTHLPPPSPPLPPSSECKQDKSSSDKTTPVPQTMSGLYLPHPPFLGTSVDFAVLL